MRRLIMSAALAAVLPLGLAYAQDEGTEVTTTIESPYAQQHPVTVNLFGGVEGYSGALAPRVQPGPNYGVSIAYDPFPFGGIEIGYSGAVNELRNRVTGGTDANSGGPDLMRNGGYAIVTPGIQVPVNASGTSTIKPYALGGIGVDRYDARGRTPGFGFSDQTVGNVPFGVGVKARLGQFAADARVSYAWQFGNQFAAADANPLRYQGQLLLGAAF